MKTYGGMEFYYYSFLILVLDEVRIIFMFELFCCLIRSSLYHCMRGRAGRMTDINMEEKKKNPCHSRRSNANYLPDTQSLTFLRFPVGIYIALFL
jgi:hypothetical protein